MFRILLFAALLFSLCSPAQEASAALSGNNAEHARSAFQFSDHNDWSNAIAHAKKSGDATLVKLITWQYLLDNDSGASFDEITRFIEENPKWPDQKKLHIRAEMALRGNNVPDHDIITWFGDDMPITGVGKIALAEALIRHDMAKPEKINYLVRDAWRNGDFDEAEEKKILDSYSSMLKRDDHIGRIDRLLWEEKVTPAKRILSYVPETYQKLYKARIALISDKRLAILAVAQVPSALKGDPGLIFDRMRYRGRRDDNSGVREMLLAAPARPPYPEKWWRTREVQIRKAIDEKKYDLARKLLANHGQVDGANLADAIWLQGFLKTEFMDRPKDGYQDFFDMYGKVHFPVSKARAAYWAGRASEKAGDREAAGNWYNTAASYPTTFYGQMGALKKNGAVPLHIPSAPAISAEAKQRFNNNELVQAIKLCMEFQELDLANHLLALIIENDEDEAEIELYAELGAKAGHPYLSVRAAKKALQQNVVLVDAGYPTPKTPSSKPVERALTLAITRQESEFDPNAKSPSKAIGMMQLLAGTAKEIARKHGIKFSKDRLYDPDYNMTLGSYYLSRLVNSYDGSYIMAIAAYNAGPGNVRNWVQEFNTPNNNVDNAVDWIEKIPFYETRNYVQRVMENLQVYRHIESDGDSPKLKIGEDLAR